MCRWYERRSNLIYTAPTGAGKTFVSEMAMLKCVQISHKKAIFVLPYVSMAAEKTATLQGVFGPVRYSQLYVLIPPSPHPRFSLFSSFSPTTAYHV